MQKDEIVIELLNAANQHGLIPTLGEVFGPCVKVSMAYSKRACETKIDELEFSVRANNSMKRAGIFTVGEIIGLISTGELAHLRNLGKKTENEIKTKLLQIGYDGLNEIEKREFFYDLIEKNYRTNQ